MFVHSVFPVYDPAIDGKLEHVITIGDEELYEFRIYSPFIFGDDGKIEEYQDSQES